MLRSLELEMDFSSASFLLEVVLKEGRVTGQRSRQCEGGKKCLIIVVEDNHSYHFRNIKNAYCDGEKADEETLGGLTKDKDFRQRIELEAEKRFNRWLCPPHPADEDPDKYPDGIVPLYMERFLCRKCREHYEKTAKRAKQEANKKLKSLGASCRFLFAV